MNSFNKFLLSSHLIKRAYAGYMPMQRATSQNIQPPVPKAIPVAPRSGVLGPAVSLLDSEPPVPKAIPVAPAMPAPAARMQAVAPSISPYQPILDVIRKGEAGVAGYDTMVGSNKPFGLTKKTLQQVLDIQAKRLKDYGGTAAGGYQILQDNLRGLAQKHKHDLNKTLFDQATQDTYAKTLMDRRGFQDYLKGKINANQMRINLAKEWAALPAKGERSYYHGKGTNKARIPSKEINDAISKALQLHRQAVKH